MNAATIKAMQEELLSIEELIAGFAKRQDRLQSQLEVVDSELSQALGDRTAVRRLLKQNDALPE